MAAPPSEGLALIRKALAGDPQSIRLLYDLSNAQTSPSLTTFWALTSAILANDSAIITPHDLTFLLSALKQSCSFPHPDPHRPTVIQNLLPLLTSPATPLPLLTLLSSCLSLNALATNTFQPYVLSTVLSPTFPLVPRLLSLSTLTSNLSNPNTPLDTLAQLNTIFPQIFENLLNPTLEDYTELEESEDVVISTCLLTTLLALKTNAHLSLSTILALSPNLLTTLPNLFYSSKELLLNALTDLVAELLSKEELNSNAAESPQTLAGPITELIEALCMQRRRLSLTLHDPANPTNLHLTTLFETLIATRQYDFECCRNPVAQFIATCLKSTDWNVLASILASSMITLPMYAQASAPGNTDHNDLYSAMLSTIILTPLPDDEDEVEMLLATTLSQVCTTLYSTNRNLYIQTVLLHLANPNADPFAATKILGYMTMPSIALQKRVLLTFSPISTRQAAFKATRSSTTEELMNAEIDMHVKAVDFVMKYIVEHAMSRGAELIIASLSFISAYALYLTKSPHAGTVSQVALQCFHKAAELNDLKVLTATCNTLRALMTRSPQQYVSAPSIAVLAEIYRSIQEVDVEVREGLCYGVCRVINQLGKNECVSVITSMCDSHVSVINNRSSPISARCCEIRLLSVVLKSFRVPSANTTLDDGSGVCVPIVGRVWEAIAEIVGDASRPAVDEVMEPINDLFREIVLMKWGGEEWTGLQYAADVFCRAVGSGKELGLLYEWVEEAAEEYGKTADVWMCGDRAKPGGGGGVGGMVEVYKKLVSHVMTKVGDIHGCSSQLSGLNVLLHRSPVTFLMTPEVDVAIGLGLEAVERPGDDGVVRSGLIFLKTVFELSDAVGGMCMEEILRPESSIRAWSKVGWKVEGIVTAVGGRVVAAVVAIACGRAGEEVQDPAGGLMWAMLSRWSGGGGEVEVEAAVRAGVGEGGSEELVRVVMRFCVAVITQRGDGSAATCMDFCGALWQVCKGGGGARKVGGEKLSSFIAKYG